MKKFISFLKYIPSMILGTLIVATMVYATGSLTAPTDTTSATGYTLDDIYTNLTTGAAAGEHTISTTTSPALSFRTLTEIYNAGVALRASSVSLANMFNGTCNNPDDPQTACNTGDTPTPFPGGTQALGGVDDFNGKNLGGEPPVGRYESTWITCDDTTYNATTNPGGNRCNTGDPGANAKDTATGLVWSYLCHDAVDDPATEDVDESTTGCTSFDTETDPAVLAPDLNGVWWDRDTYYTWNGYSDSNSTTPYAGNGVDGEGAPLTASELCSKHTGWSLPSQKQLMMAYIDGAYGNDNLEPQGVERYYWSATTVAYYATRAWLVGLSDGSTSFNNKYDPNGTVRCVRE